MDLDKNVMQKIVECDPSNVNSLMRTNKRFSHLILDNKNLMRDIALSRLITLEQDVKFHCKRLTSSPHYDTIIIEFRIFYEKHNVVFKSKDANGFFDNVEFEIDNFEDYIKQPTQKDALNNLLRLCVNLRNLKKHLELPKHYIYLDDLLCNLEYIYTFIENNQTNSKSSYKEYWNKFNRVIGNPTTSSTIITTTMMVVGIFVCAREGVHVYQMLKK